MEFIVVKSIRKAKKYWRELVSDLDTNYYQTYPFAKACYIYRKTSISSIIHGNLMSRFVIAMENGEVVCIAPLDIEKNPKKVIHILGHGTNAGYLDFIYRDPQYVIPTYLYCQKKYKDYKFDFIFVPEYSPLVGVLNVSERFSCYKIYVDDYEKYFSGLSKGTRQNIRTAYNRMTTDGRKYELKLYTRSSKEITYELSKCNEIYQKRRLDWIDDAKEVSDMRKRIFLARDVIYEALRRGRAERGVLAVLYIDGQQSAFFIGFSYDNGIYIPRLAIDTEYARYSPGMILINEFLKEHGNCDYEFDLCRGDENYKSKLGGAETKTYRLTE